MDRSWALYVALRKARERIPGRRLQVAQDPVERLLVGVVFFPSPEVADVSLIAELHRLDLVVDNAELAKDVRVVMDGRLVGTLQGKSLFLPNVPSGSHRVEIKGILNNKPAYAEGTVAIIPGQVAPLKLALVPQGPPMTATA